MKNKIIGLSVLAVLLITVVVVYFIWGNKPSENGGLITPSPSASSTPKETIYDLELSEARYITIKNPESEAYKLGHTQIIENDETVDKYTLVSDSSIDVEEDEIGTIFAVITGLSGTVLDSSVVNEATDEDFGFDKATVVTLEMRDGTEYVLEVGDYTTSLDGTFVRKKGESTVYVIGYGEGLYLKSEINDLKNLYLFVATSEEFVNRIKMTKKGEFQYTLEGSQVEDSSTELWNVTEPISWRITFDSNFLNYTSAFYSIIAAECADETEDFAKYGLDVPAYEIEFTVDDKTTYKLSLGNLTENGAYYYARWNDGNNIYLITADQFSEIDKTLREMVGNIVYYCSYFDLSRFEVEYGGQSYSFDIGENAEEKTENDVFTYDGKSFSEKEYPEVCNAFRNIYKGALGLWAYEFDTEVSPELKDPEITLTFHNRVENEVVKLEYVRRDNDRYYIFMNGEYTGALSMISTINNPTDQLTPGLANALTEFSEIFKTVK